MATFNGNLSSNILVISADDPELGLSVNLSEYDFDLPGDPILTPNWIVTDNVSLTDIDLNERTLDGILANSFSELFYNHIWIIPSELDITGAPASFTTDVVIWNSYFVSRTLTSINEIGSGGIDVTGLTLPNTFNPLQTKTVTVSIEPSAPATIDDLFSFVFTGVSPDATLHVFGVLSVIFSYRHNWREDFVETIEYLTDVVESKSGKERRVRLRKFPRRYIENSILFADNTDIDRHALTRATYHNQMKYGHGKSWILPFDPDIITLDTNISAGTTVLNFDTRYLDISIGGYLMLFLFFDNVEIVRIASFNTTSVTLQSPGTARSWVAGTAILPARAAFINDNIVRGTSIMNMLEEAKPSWTINLSESDVTNRTTPYVPTYTYKGHDVWFPNPDYSNDLSIESYSDLRILDSGYGIYKPDARFSYDREKLALEGIVLKDKAEIAAFLGFLEYRAGKLNPMWVPTEANDFQIVGSGTTGGQIIKIRNIGYSTYIRNSDSRKDLCFLMIDGSILFRRIVGSAFAENNTENISIDVGLPFNWTSESFRRVSYLRFVRFDTDAFQIKYFKNNAAVVDGLSVVDLLSVP